MASVSDLRERMRGWFHREPELAVPRVIVVADASANRQSTVNAVTQLGYQAEQITSVAGVLTYLEKEEPEFLLLGFELDDDDGLGALSQIREVDIELPIVMLAADLWDPRVPEAMRRGAVAYLARPWGMDDLREILGRR